MEFKSTGAAGSGNCQISRMVAQGGDPLCDWLPKRRSPSGEGLRVPWKFEFLNYTRQFDGTYRSFAASLTAHFQVMASEGTVPPVRLVPSTAGVIDS